MRETAGFAEAATPDPVTPAETEGRRQHLWDLYDRAPEKRKAEARRRLEIVRSVELMVAAGASRQAAVAAVAQDEGAATVRRWIKMCDGLHRSDRLAALLPNHQGRPRLPGYDPRIYDWFKADYLRRSHPPATASYNRTARLAAAAKLPMPRIAALARRLKRELSPVAIVLAREGSEAVEKMYPIVGR